MRIQFLRVWPRIAATAAETQLRLAGGGEGRAYHLGGLHYRAGLVGFPRFSASTGIDEGGFTGRTVPASAQLEFAPSDITLRDQMLALHWQRARLEIDASDEGVAIPPRLLTGVVDDISYAEGRFQLRVADASQRFDKRILASPFAGTGGIEGYSGAAGRPKRRSWGQVWNVEGRLLDQANNIWEFGDPAIPLNGITALKDMGRAGPTALVAWQGSIAATLAALIASVPAQGGGVVAPSIACAKWWTQPQGPLTADIEGEIGTGYVATAPAIASRLVELAGGAVITNLATALSWRGGSAGWHVDRDSTTWAEALDAICLGVSLLWIVNPDGTVTLRQCSFDDPATTLKAVFISRDRTLPPTATRKLIYKLNNRLHNDGEISAAILAGDVTYADGTPVEALKPAEPGATLGARAGTNLVDSGGATLSDNMIRNLAISIGANGALSGAGGGQVTIAGLGYVGDLNATSGDNMIRNAALAANANDWVVTLGTAARTTSATAGDQPAFMRATAATNLVALNGGGTGTSAIPIRPGTRLFYSWLARADIVNSGSGNDRRRCYLRQTFYTASGSGIGTWDAYDEGKAATAVEAGGCSAAWELHRAYYDAPANAAFVKLELFPLLGSTGAGKYIDVTKVALAMSQAGADRTVDQLLLAQVQPRSTVGDNLCRNGDFSNGADGWWLKSTGGWATSELVWRSGAAEGLPGWLRHTPTGFNINRATYHPTRYDRSNPFHPEDGMPVTAGKDVYLQFAYRSDGNMTFDVDAWFYTSGGTQIAVAQPFAGGPFSGGIATFVADTAGAVVRSAIAKITVPAGANIMFLRVTMGRPTGSSATYGEVGLFSLTAAEPGATVGARAGTNLVDSSGVALGDSAIKNMAISIGANGALSGAGGGQVTIGGLGYTGDLNATLGAKAGTNLVDSAGASLGDSAIKNMAISIGANGALSGAGGGQVTATGLGVEEGADVTKNAQVVIAPPPAQIIYRDWQGAAKSGQLPRTLTPTVTRGGSSIRTDNATSYSITTSGVTATVNNSNGSSDKGRISMTAGAPGSISLTITRDGVAYGPFAIPVTVQDDAPPNDGGSGGGSDSTLEDVTGTSYAQMTSADSGEAIFSATITAGQSLVGTAPLTYNWSHNSSSGANKLVAKWQYKPSGGSWTDFDAAITGSEATWSAVDLSGEPGSINVNQSKSGLGAGTYECRLVGAKETSSGNAITIASGTATLSIS